MEKSEIDEKIWKTINNLIGTNPFIASDITLKLGSGSPEDYLKKLGLVNVYLGGCAEKGFITALGMDEYLKPTPAQILARKSYFKCLK